VKFLLELQDGRKLFYVGVRMGARFYCHPVYAISPEAARFSVKTTGKVESVVRVVKWK
jgi:hypothetical protein